MLKVPLDQTKRLNFAVILAAALLTGLLIPQRPILLASVFLGCIILLLVFITESYYFLLPFLLLGYSFTWPLFELRPLGQLLFVRLDDLVFFLLIGKYLFDIVTSKNSAVHLDRTEAALLLWLALTMTSALFVGFSANLENWSKSIFLALRNIQYIAVFFIVRKYIKQGMVKRSTLIRLLYLASLFVIVSGLLEWLSLIPSRTDVGLQATLANPHSWGITSTLAVNHGHIGTYLLIAFFLMLSLFVSTRAKLNRVIYLLSMVACVFVIFLSTSRTSLIALVFGLFVWLLMRRKLTSWVSFTLMLVLFVSVGHLWGGPLANIEVEGTNPLSRMTRITIDQADRVSIWRTSYHILSSSWKNALFGIGIGQFRESFLALAGFARPSAHNNFLHILVELGVIGLLLFLWMIYRLAMSLRERVRSSCSIRDKEIVIGHMAAFAALLLTAFAQETFYPVVAFESLLGYFFLATAIVLSNADNCPD